MHASQSKDPMAACGDGPCSPVALMTPMPLMPLMTPMPLMPLMTPMVPKDLMAVLVLGPGWLQPLALLSTRSRAVGGGGLAARDWHTYCRRQNM